jgi:hypothetical protein
LAWHGSYGYRESTPFLSQSVRVETP